MPEKEPKTWRLLIRHPDGTKETRLVEAKDEPEALNLALAEVPAGCKVGCAPVAEK